MLIATNTSLAEPRALVHSLQHQQHLTARLIQNGQHDLHIGQTLGYWTLQSTFAEEVF